MSLDEPRNPRHAALLAKDPRDLTDREWDELEWHEREQIESPEAEEARWRHRMRQAASERPAVHYRDSGWAS